ncbi:MAG TPA: response regulator [Thermoanaerobaculia bacterium]|jgi:DNA-binding response OmpR family regulator|nr:response regulator [Thermoanaerobaculia bacterium]
MTDVRAVATKPAYRALVVEDDPAIRRLVEKLLSRLKIEIDVAGDGRTAVEKLQNQHYSVLVLDLMVPELNGFEVIDFLKRENIRVPVAVVSAVSQQALTKLDLDIVKLVISKPFDVDEFTKAILALCAEGESQA